LTALETESVPRWSMSRWQLVIFLALAGAAHGQSGGQLSDSERDYKAALASCEAQQCRELPAILNGLGSLYYEQGRYSDSEPLLLRAVDLLGRSEGDRRLLAAVLSNLAAVNRIRGRFAEAKRLYEQARSLQAGEDGNLASSSLLARLALLAQDMG